MERKHLCVFAIFVMVGLCMPGIYVQSKGEQGWDEIYIDATVFPNETVRLNTEVYQIAASYCEAKKLERYFGKNMTALSVSVIRNMNPLIAVAITTAETPGYADRSITWTSAIYSKALAASGFCRWDKLSVQEVDSDFYLYHGLSEYFACGRNCQGVDGTMHMVCTGVQRNDNDSLGPAQILRRYLYQAGGCITAYNADNSVYGITTDLMRWEDNVVWVLNNSLSKFRSVSSSSSRGSYEVQNEYELLVLMAIAHNTGASYIKAAGSAYVSPYWQDADGIWLYARLLTSPANIAYIKEHYIEPWYANVVLPSVQEGHSFELPGNAFSDGDVNQTRSSALLQELGFDLEQITYEKSKGEVRSGWRSTDGCFQVLEHKQRYPLKSLVNYLALERLYYSGRRE